MAPTGNGAPGSSTAPPLSIARNASAVVLANKAEQRAILAPDWRHNTGQLAEAPRLGGLDTRCIQADNEECRCRGGGAQRPEQIEEATTIRGGAWDGLDERQRAGWGSPLVGVQATGAVVGRR
jgi:hypothetical protein